MADDNTSKLSYCSVTKSLNASGRKPQNQISFQEFKGREITTKQQEKPNTSIDLRHPQLVHLYSSENGTMADNKLNGVGDMPSPSTAASFPNRSTRPQMARRGGRFRFFNERGCSRSETISAARKNTTEVTGDTGHLRPHAGSQSLNHLDSNLNPGSCTTPYMSGVNSESILDPINNQVSCSIGHSDVVDVAGFVQPDPNFKNFSTLNADDANLDVSNQPSTIIHLKLVAPPSSREESEAFINATRSESREREETCSFAPSDIQEANLDIGCLAKDSMNVDPIPDQCGDGRATKRKLSDASDCFSSSDDDLPLIVHCKRSRKVSAERGSMREGKVMQEVKRTYERGGSTVARAEDSQRAVEKHGIVYKESNGSGTVGEGSVGDCLEPWKKSVQSGHSQGSGSWQRHLEQYERSSFAKRNATDGKTTPGRKVRVSGKTPSDSESPRNPRRPGSQVKKAMAVMSTRKTQVFRCLKPGPVSLKRKQMKEFGVDPRKMSQVLKQLTERKCPVGRTSMSFLCNSHQNYHDGCLVFRLTTSLPAKERVVVHVSVKNRDDLDPVGHETIVLWRMSDGEVDELQKQVKQEMEHKRTEHIMPVVLQMSYEQIETAYEQVKKDMKTYEITEKDSDVEEDEEDEDEEDRYKDEEVEDESKNKEEDEENEKSSRLEEGGERVEELENDTDENLHVRSYEIIVHDESSKTISCETVKYLEWRKKHPSFENGESGALRKEVESQGAFETGVENDPPVESPNAVEHTDTSAAQTDYSRCRPKRHAVDYSPSAFAPIRLMEGKRLGGKTTAPPKLQTKKKAVNDTCQGSKSLILVNISSEGDDKQHGVIRDQANDKKRQSGEVVRNKCSSKSGHRSRRRQKLPKAPQKESATALHDIVSKNTLNAILPKCEPSARDDNHKADIESDDDVPVILDVSDMPLSPTPSSPATPEQPPVLSERNNCLEKQPTSAYDVVRNEYIRLRDLTRAGAASDIPLLEAACDGGEERDVERCSTDEKLLREEAESFPALSVESIAEGDHPSRESSDLTQTHLEPRAPTENAANGVCSAKMPSLQRLCGDDSGTAAEELTTPPDLGLPIECLTSQQQQPTSPVLPPDLHVETGEMNGGGDAPAGIGSFPLMSSSPESIGGIGDTTVLCDSMVGGVH